MTHRDRPYGLSGRRKEAMRGIVKAFRRPPTGRMDDRNGGLPRLSDSVAHGS